MKLSERKNGFQTSFNADVKNVWSDTFTPLLSLRGVLLRQRYCNLIPYLTLCFITPAVDTAS
jgi:hypothetical protein